MAMASALRISCSSSRMRPFLWSSLCYMSSLPSEPVYEKEKSRVTLNAPLEVVDPEIAGINELEKARQSKGPELIPSENFTPVSVMQAVGCTMPNIKSEGYPGPKYYSGLELIDMARTLWQIEALRIFRLDPEKWGVIEQSLSGVPYNFQVFTALLKPHERIMASDPVLHGYYAQFGQTDTNRISVMSIFFETMFYRFNRSTDDDLDQLEKSATLFRPKLIAADHSIFYPPEIYARFRKVCDKHKAIFLADMGRVSALVPARLKPSPFKHADIVTAMTTGVPFRGWPLRRPRGDIIFFRKGVKEINKQGKEVLYDFEDKINQAVFPGLPNHKITAGLAVALEQATAPEYKAYQEQVLSNCARFAQTLVSKGYELVSGGTENYLVSVNLKKKGLDGCRVQSLLKYVDFVVDKQIVPDDVSRMLPGGITMGTLALTSRGFVEEDFAKVADFFDRAVNLALKIKADERKEGKEINDFDDVIQENTNIQYEILLLRRDVNKYSKQFPIIGFKKETMKE